MKQNWRGGDRADVELLAEAIASLVHTLDEENQKAAITVEEASFALHFRRSKEEVRQALLALERQGRASQIGLAQRWLSWPKKLGFCEAMR
ncbi:MAG: hypothetical protein WB762_22040 [Candidatus Sulfotelmatobacter sp.]